MSKVRQIFKFQLWNYLYLIILLITGFFIAEKQYDFFVGKFLGISTVLWLIIAVSLAVLHQLYVQLIWRIELVTAYFTKKFGIKKSYRMFGVGFFILFISRLLVILVVAWSNRYTLRTPPWVNYIASAFVLYFVFYAFYSVVKYFTFHRALGIDHFDRSYAEPFETRGIYKYTNNGMYVYAMLIVYLPGLLLFSKAALLLGLFNQLYAWGHYFSVERPDMKVIYGKTP